MELRDYQLDIARRTSECVRMYKICYITAEVRVGKSLMALEGAKLLNAKNVLFLTKKKAIGSIESDYVKMGYKYNLTVVNDESIHLIEDKTFDLVIHDEHHRFGAFPKPSERTKIYKKLYGHLPMIFLSGTASPESFSQLYHQFWVSNYSPFQHKNFYKWAAEFVTITQRTYGYGMINDYSNANFEKINPYIKNLMINYTQKEAGFSTEVQEHVLYCEMKESTYALTEKLRKDNVVEGKTETILADTGVKMMGKLHQIFSGTVKFESGNSMVLDTSKAEFIKEKFEGVKIALFYKFKEELNCLKQVFAENLTTDLDEFNNTSKNIALQIVSGREGISLAAAKYIVYYNIDFSATSYWQSRDRLTTMDRMSNEVYWIFSKGGLEEKIYKAVSKKKNYTLRHFVKDERATISI